MIGICHYPFSQAHRMYSTKSESYKLGTSDDYEVSINSYNKHITLMVVMITGEIYAGAEVIWKCLYLLISIVVILTLL